MTQNKFGKVLKTMIYGVPLSLTDFLPQNNVRYSFYNLILNDIRNFLNRKLGLYIGQYRLYVKFKLIYCNMFMFNVIYIFSYQKSYFYLLKILHQSIAYNILPRHFLFQEGELFFMNMYYALTNREIKCQLKWLNIKNAKFSGR